MQNQFDRTRTGAERGGGVNPAVSVGVPRATRDAGLRSYMLSVYNYMASGVLLTGIVAMLFAPYARDVLINEAGTGMSGLGWIIMFAPLGFVMAMSFGLHRMQTGTLQMLFWAFATVMGLSMASIFFRYTGPSIALTFFATSAAFLDYVRTTRKPFLLEARVPAFNYDQLSRGYDYTHHSQADVLDLAVPGDVTQAAIV